MIIRICAFTTKGWQLTKKIENLLENHVIEARAENVDLNEWIKECFNYKLPIIFVGAVGIAVRKIAPYVNSKLIDSPVIVVDESGKFVIPVLSNHLGGANEIAKMVAKATGGQTVITTATDIEDVFAVDVFAKKNGLIIENKEGIKAVSSKILDGSCVYMAVNPQIELRNEQKPDYIKLVDLNTKEMDICVDLPERNFSKERNSACTLIFKPYVIGVGCKSNTDYLQIEDFISKTLTDRHIDEELIAGMASIDLKRKEKGLLYYAANHRIDFTTYTAEELQDVEGEYSESEFVKKVTGVSNVCERAAARLAGDGAMQVMPKQANNGITLAVYKRKARINTWTKQYI